MIVGLRRFFGELFAAFIPNKVARNRWRGLFRFGIFRAAKVALQVHRGKNIKPKYYLAVCAIAKNEGPYFKEWIEWHKAKGVEKFYVYDNESDDNTKRLLAPYVKSGLVEYKFWPGKKQQLNAYEDCLAQHRFDAKWIAFIDLDEYVVPIEDKTIPEFLKKMEKFSVVEINWLIYGSGGAIKKKQGKIMDRFKRHSMPNDPLNRHIKSVVDPRRTVSFVGAHEAVRLSGTAANANGVPIKRKIFWVREPVQDKIRINHYAVKSYEEFTAKRARGRARSANQWAEEYFEKYDLNDCE